MKEVTIKIGSDPGEIMKGDPLTLMARLRDSAYRPEVLPEETRRNLSSYMDHLERDIWRLYGVGIKATGLTLKQRAHSMIRELARVGFIKLIEGDENK